MKGLLLLPVFFICLYPAQLFSAALEKKMIVARIEKGSAIATDRLLFTCYAVAMGAEYLELPIMMSKDGELIVFGALSLEKTTDVAQRFPEKKRADDHYYPIDFTFPELSELRSSGDLYGNTKLIRQPIPSLHQALDLIEEINKKKKEKTSLILEPKYLWFHRDEQRDLSSSLLDQLFSIDLSNTPLFLQSYDPEELQRLDAELLPQKGLQFPLIQLVDTGGGREAQQKELGRWQPYNYDWLFTNIGLRMLASYATAVAFPLWEMLDAEGNFLMHKYINDAHLFSIKVLGQIPEEQSEMLLPVTADTLLFSRLLEEGRLDGLYTSSFLEAAGWQKNLSPVNTESPPLPLFHSQPEFKPEEEESDREQASSIETMD